MLSKSKVVSSANNITQFENQNIEQPWKIDKEKVLKIYEQF